jgi:hypothetical protein
MHFDAHSVGIALPGDSSVRFLAPCEQCALRCWTYGYSRHGTKALVFRIRRGCITMICSCFAVAEQSTTCTDLGGMAFKGYVLRP